MGKKIFYFVLILALNTSYTNSAFSQEIIDLTASKSEISKAMKEAKDPTVEVFMVTISGVVITGKEWKLKEHIGSKRPIEMSIDSTTLILDSIIAFQSPYGMAQRIESSSTKASISYLFAYFLTKNSDYSLLYQDVIESSFYSPQKMGNETKWKDKYTISYPGNMATLTKTLLKELSESKKNAKEVYKKYNGKVDKTLDRLIEFINACNLE